MPNNNTLATQCFNNIRELILNGQLLPGEKLKGEYLKQKFNVGLSPIREALFRLTETNLVDFKDKIGFTVATLTESQVHDVLITHAKIECLMFKESIETGDDEWEANIMGALYKLAKLKPEKANTISYMWANRNNEFHNALVSACKTNGLIQIRDKYLQKKEWFATLANNHIEEPLIAASNHDHTKLADMAIARKWEEGCNKLYKHMMAGANILVQNLKANGHISEV